MLAPLPRGLGVVGPFPLGGLSAWTACVTRPSVQSGPTGPQASQDDAEFLPQKLCL